VLNEKEALKLEIKNAENLHGHLGPFLVIGVKMARLAKKTLCPDNAKNWDMQVIAKLPLATPFSCILDSIQATTQCTVGNQKLKVENHEEGMTVTFKIKNQNKALTIHVNPQVIEMLKEQLSKGKPNEDLAWEIAVTPEKYLFKIEKR